MVLRPNLPIRSGFAKGYKYEAVGIYHNYYVTPKAWEWPFPTKTGSLLIDGFSPNLNKELHAGHLKNLAVATAISNICGDGKSVAMLGASLGVNEGALEKYKAWCNLAGYNPKIFLDTELPPPSVKLYDGDGEYVGCKLYNGVVVYKSNGKATYASHDLSFAENVKPTHYLTGSEQKEHFNSLGLGEKHLSLGLVLGPDGKKMKSSIKKEGDEKNAMSAQELLQEVVCALDETPEPEKLAWNILAWQFNSSSVSQNTKCNIKLWAKSESPGLYITHTFAKVSKAIEAAGLSNDVEITQQEANLLGLASQYNYYYQKAQDSIEPCWLAQYALILAKALSAVYTKEKFVGGNPAVVYAANVALESLKKTMNNLGMYTLKKV